MMIQNTVFNKKSKK